MLLDFFAQGEDLPDDIRILAFEQGRGLCVREALVLPAFIKDDLHQFQVILVSLRKSKRGFDFFIVDEFFCFFRCAVVFSHYSLHCDTSVWSRWCAFSEFGAPKYSS